LKETNKLYALPKTMRLHLHNDLQEFFDRPKRLQYGHFVFQYKMLSEPSDQLPVQWVFIVPKARHKRANKRNRLRRRLKELTRLHAGFLQALPNNKKIGISLAYLGDIETPWQELEQSFLEVIAKFAEKLKHLSDSK
jgi:ribonuclease P protein component